MRTYIEKIKEWYKNANKKKLYVGLAFGMAIMVILWAFLSAIIITKNFNRDQLLGSEDKQEVGVTGVILVESKDDKKFWEIYAQSGNYDSKDKVAVLNNVIGNFYKDNEVSMSFTSSRGSYNEVKQQIILYDNIHIVIKDGTSLYCDTLIWSGSDKDVVVDGNVKIKQDKRLISTAKKGLISSDYSKFKIIGNSVTKLYGSEGKK